MKKSDNFKKDTNGVSSVIKYCTSPECYGLAANALIKLLYGGDGVRRWCLSMENIINGTFTGKKIYDPRRLKKRRR